MTKKSDFLKSLKIESMRIRSLKVSTQVELYESNRSTTADLRYRWKHKEDTLNDGFVSSVTLDLIINILEDNEHKQSLLDFNCSIEAVYYHDLKLDKKLFNHLSKNLFVIHFWPYVRELIQNITYRIGMKPIVMPPLGQLLQ